MSCCTRVGSGWWQHEHEKRRSKELDKRELPRAAVKCHDALGISPLSSLHVVRWGYSTRTLEREREREREREEESLQAHRLFPRSNTVRTGSEVCRPLAERLRLFRNESQSWMSVHQHVQEDRVRFHPRSDPSVSSRAECGGGHGNGQGSHSRQFLEWEGGNGC